MLFGVCIYVLLTAPQLRYFIANGSAEWIAENYRQLGLFLMGVTFCLFWIAVLNTYFLARNIRLTVSVADVKEQDFEAKLKRQPENRINAMLTSLDEDERAELRDLINMQDDNQVLRSQQ
jgi:hypothetical protein